MLVSEYFGRCHDACLEVVVGSDECGEKCDECFTGADISLQESVHLFS